MEPMKKQRLDRRLVAQGLCPSRALAQRLIRAGRVLVGGRLVDKPAALVSPEVRVELKSLPRYVSRGGEKLEGALRAFGLEVTGAVCLDVGASTGGFTDCLLQHGAARVYAVDVGRGQLDARLRTDPRVVVREGVNARVLGREHVAEPVDLATVDVAFISLEKVLPALVPLLAVEGALVALVKPQFEAGRAQVGRGGVVRDPRVHAEVLARIAAFAARELDLRLQGAVPSPLRGPAGNLEFFLCWRRRGPARALDWSAFVAEAHGTEPAHG